MPTDYGSSPFTTKSILLQAKMKGDFPLPEILEHELPEQKTSHGVRNYKPMGDRELLVAAAQKDGMDETMQERDSRPKKEKGSGGAGKNEPLVFRLDKG